MKTKIKNKIDRELFKELKGYIEYSLNRIIVGNERLSINKGTCYTTSKIACKILQGLNYKCRVQKVEVIVGDEIGRKVFAEQEKTNSFDKDIIIKSGGWCIGLGMNSDPDKNYFHYVVYFYDDDEIMDLTFNQATREKYNLICEPYWEHIDNLPETIMKIYKKDNGDGVVNPMINAPNVKAYSKMIIKTGIKLLEKYKK